MIWWTLNGFLGIFFTVGLPFRRPKSANLLVSSIDQMASESFGKYITRANQDSLLDFKHFLLKLEVGI